MKKIIYLIAILYFTISSCKKPGNEYTVPAAIYFDLIGKDGNNLIHSLKDSLSVTYVLNGVTETSWLTIYKVQTSPTDTTSVTKYNGFVVTDRNPIDNQGYISSPSGAGVRNFNLYLNGANIGSIYLDYWGYLSSYPQPTSPTFTFKGVPVTLGSIVGIYSDGSKITEENNYPNANNVYLLQVQ